MDNLAWILDIWTARISAGLAFFLSIIYMLRILNIKLFKNRVCWVKSLNNTLRKNHRTMGIAMIFLGLIHGIFSTESVLSLNLGTACWIISILLGLNWALRRKIKLKKAWIYYHRLLTVLFLLTLVAHIVDVKWVSSSFKETPASSEAETPEFAVESTSIEDGIYYGESSGYKPGLKVKVSIQNGDIYAIELLENNETPKFLDMVVPDLLDRVISEQSTDVDAVSGATRSSEGILAAVEDAISE